MSRFVERGVWLLLFAAMAAVVFGYIFTSPSAKLQLPVIGRVGPFSLTNQFGMSVNESAFQGQVWVANVVFTRCPGQCHRLSKLMARLRSGIPSSAPVKFVTLTADPEFDSPAILMKYSERYGDSGGRWTLLTGNKTNLLDLAVKGLKFSVVENPNAESGESAEKYIHSSAFAIVDRRGDLRAMVQEEEPDAEGLIIQRVNALIKER
jgi:protein SCO1/2